MKTRNRWTLVLWVLVVVACVGWFVGSFTTSFTSKVSAVVTYDIILHGDRNLEQIFSAASATVHRLGYKTADGTSSFSSYDKSSMSLKARHEDGTEVEIHVYSKTDAPPHLRIRVAERRVDYLPHKLTDPRNPLAERVAERASRILEAITSSRESPEAP